MQNKIITSGWSNPQSRELYHQRWSEQPKLREQAENGVQCGGCSFFAPFNSDWGLCCHDLSPHYLETVFEHFTCEESQQEGWGPHSFSADENYHCRCQDLFGNRRAFTEAELLAERESYVEYLRNQLKLFEET